MHARCFYHADSVCTACSVTASSPLYHSLFGQAAGDLPTLLTASRALLHMFKGVPGEEERAGKQQMYVERKAGELAAAVAAAQAAPCHAALLSWRTAGKA